VSRAIDAQFVHGAWTALLAELLGAPVVGAQLSAGAGGKRSREVRDMSVRFPAADCVIDVPARGLNYRFMVAEWVWMSLGREDVEGIARYNQRLRAFSDDGIRFAGAYGPMLRDQFAWAVKQLRDDPNTRQAVVQIWRPRPARSKDVPCTLSFDFLARAGRLHMTATMRSSDAWLGVPYDAFNFSMILNMAAGALGLEVGELTMNLASSHLYEQHWDLASDVVCGPPGQSLRMPALPGMVPVFFHDVLNRFPREPFTDAGSPWQLFLDALYARTSAEALEILRGERG
jgi:hypothetical protein